MELKKLFKLIKIGNVEIKNRIAMSPVMAGYAEDGRAGVSPLVPNIPGIMKPNVLTGEDVLPGGGNIGDNVVVIGGGMVGSEVAAILAEKGKKVTILEMPGHIAIDVASGARFDLLRRLRASGIQIEVNVEVSRISESGVWGKRIGCQGFGGNEVFFGADTVIVAVGKQSDNDIAERLEGNIAGFYHIGDSTRPGRIKGTILDGFITAQQSI